MSPETYRQINQRVNTAPGLRRAVMFANGPLAFAVAALYLAGLIAEIGGGDMRQVILLLAGPAAAFLLTTLLRQLIGRRRPYHVQDIRPVVPKESESGSMPSRHMASAFAIGSALIALGHPVPGAAALALGIILGAARVLGGAHYLTDVLAGAALGLLSGLAVWWLR